MRKFFKSILSVGAVIPIMASSSVCLGQASSYFIRNDSLVKENAKFTVDSMFSDLNQIERIPYEKAIGEVFEKYWDKNKGKVKFNWNELSNAQDQIDRIKAEIAQNIALDNEFKEELEKTQQLILSEDNAEVNTGDVIAHLKDMIDRLEKESEALDTQISAEQKNLKLASESLNQSNEEVNSAADSQSDISRALKSADDLQKLIGSLQKKLNADIVSVNISDFDSIQNLYNQNIGYIEAFNQVQYNDLKGAMDVITSYRPLIEALNNSLVAMSSKYNAKANKDLAQELESIIKNGKSKYSSVKFDTTLLTSAQITQCQSVISALKDEERSSKNLNYLLDYILREHPAGIEDASDYDVATDIENVVNIVNPGQNRYNPYYVKFNDILDALETELKAQNRTSEELKEYIQLKKDEK